MPNVWAPAIVAPVSTSGSDQDIASDAWTTVNCGSSLSSTVAPKCSSDLLLRASLDVHWGRGALPLEVAIHGPGGQLGDSVIWTPGRLNHPAVPVLHFGSIDGTDYVSPGLAPAVPNLNITGDLTIEAWAYFNDNSAARTIASLNWGTPTSSPYSFYWIAAANSRLGLRHTIGGVQTFHTAASVRVDSTGTTEPLGSWYYVAMVRDDTAKTVRLAIFDPVQGQWRAETSTTTYSGTVDAAGGGGRMMVGSGGGGAWNDMIGMVRIWSAVRPDDDLQRDMFGLSENPSQIANLELSYEGRLDNAGQVLDSSGNQYHGTKNGAVDELEVVRPHSLPTPKTSNGSSELESACHFARY